MHEQKRQLSYVWYIFCQKDVLSLVFSLPSLVFRFWSTTHIKSKHDLIFHLCINSWRFFIVFMWNSLHFHKPRLASSYTHHSCTKLTILFGFLFDNSSWTTPRYWLLQNASMCIQKRIRRCPHGETYLMWFALVVKMVPSPWACK